MAENLTDLIISLFDCVINDPSQNLYEVVKNTLNILGNKQPELFLSVSHAYLLQHNRLSNSNRSFILNCITKVLEESGILDDCDEQQALLLINLATNEMTMTKDNDEICANSAKEVLVTLSKSNQFVGHVMDAVLNKYPPGHTSSPHRFIILTLASISQHNSIGFLTFLTDVLSRTVLLLSYIKQDAVRSAWCYAICSFCEAIIESFSLKNTNKLLNDSDSSLNNSKDCLTQNEYADQLESAYEIIFHWASAKDSKCRADAAECIGTLSQLINRQRINKDLKKLVAMFLTVSKKTVNLLEIYSITKGIGNFLNACSCSEETFQVEHYLDDIFNTFFPHVCVFTEQSLTTDDNASPNAIQIKIRNEAYRCFHVASRSFADRQVYYLLHKMQNDKDTVKLGATNLMRHLLNSAGSQMEDKRSLITMGLKPLLTDEALSIRVKMSICQLCVALADHGYVHPEAGGLQVIQFLLTNLILKADVLPTNKKTINSGVEEISINQLHTQCAQALHTISNTCEASLTLLWPLIFEYVCLEAYTPVISDIFKCIRILTNRVKEKGNKLDFITDFDSNNKIAGPHQVMSRLLVCMNGAPLNNTFLNRALEALKVFSEICSWFHESIPDVAKEFFPQMFSLLDEMNLQPLTENGQRKNTTTTTTFNDFVSHSQRDSLNFQQKRFDYSLELKCVRTQRWQAHILELLNGCVCAVNNGDWRQSLATAQTKQLQLYGDNSHDKAFLMRCLGQTLSRITNKNFVVDQILLMIRTTTHSNQIERVGCAMAIGHCSQTHTDLILTELENVSKWEHTKKSNAGIFSYIKVFFGLILFYPFTALTALFLSSKNNRKSSNEMIRCHYLIKDAMPYGRAIDTEVVHLRATLVLCYGYVVYFCPPELVVQRIEQTVFPFLRQYIANCKDIVMKEAHLETIHLIALTVHPQHLTTEYKFENRYECFSYIKLYVQSENSETLSSWIRLLAAKAASSLIQLDPPISDNELWDLGSVLTQQIFPIGREKSGLKTLDPLSVSSFLLSPIISSSSNLTISKNFSNRFPSAFLIHRNYPLNNTTFCAISNSNKITEVLSKGDSKKQKTLSLTMSSGSATGNTKASSLLKQNSSNAMMSLRVFSSTVMDATVMQYRDAIGYMVARQPFVETVSQLLKMFIPYYNSLTDHERTRAIDSTVLVLTVYAENASDCILGRANDFLPLSCLLGRLGPRLADSLQAVRILSIRAIWLAFKLTLLRRGHSPQDIDLVDSTLFDPTLFIDKFLGNEGKLEPFNCRSAIIAISKEIEKRLPQSQVQMYISVLFNMLSDNQSYVSSSAAQLLSIIMNDRGHLLHAEAEILVSTMLEHLTQVHSSLQTYTDLLNGFSLFTAHQQYIVIDVLLKQPLPYSITTADAWQIMARDGTQFVIAVDTILELLGTGINHAQQPIRSNSFPSLETNFTTENEINEKKFFETQNTNENIDEEKVEINNQIKPLSIITDNLSQNFSNTLKNRISTTFISSDNSTQISSSTTNVKPHYEIYDVGGVAIKIVTNETCALISALKELIKNGEPEDALFSRIPLLLAALLQILVAVIDTQFPAGPRTIATSALNSPLSNTTAATTNASINNTLASTKNKKSTIIITPELCRLASTPAGLVADALKTLLLRIRAESVLETMNSERAFTNIIHLQHYISAISTMCKSLCEHKPKFVGLLLELMAERVTSSCEAERTASVIVLSALILKCPKENGEFDPEIFVIVIKALGKALNDSKLIVRKLAIRGHGLIGSLHSIKSLDEKTRKELLQKFTKIAVDAALIGLDDFGDRSDQLAIEAIDALNMLVNVTDKQLLAQILPQLLLRVRPCFEKENASLRAAAFSLYAGLGSNVGECDIYKESLHNNIVSIILHLNDTDEAVQCQCSHILVLISSLLNSDHATNLIEKEIIDNQPIKNYSSFVKDFSFILAISFSDRLNYYALSCSNYFKSQSARIRQNAAMMIGLLLASLTTELRGTLSKNLIFSGLVQLLKDPEEKVRIMTVRAIANLHAFS